MADTCKPIKLLICGGGNGSHTISAYASSLPDVEVKVMSLFKDEAERWRNTLGDDDIVINATYQDGSTGEIRGKPKLITNDPAVAMEGVDAVFFVVPAFAHQEYFDAIIPYLKENTIIVGMPGQAGFEFQALHCLKGLADKCAVISLDTLPWACRLIEFGRCVQILGFKFTVGASLIKGKGTYKMEPISLVQHTLGPMPVIKKANNYLAVNLNSRGMIHPPVLYGRWKDWDGVPLETPPLIYQGMTENEANCLSQLSDEIMETAKEIGKQRPELDMSEVIHILDWLKQYYSKQISDFTNLQTSFRTNKAYDGLVHPMKKVEGGYVPDFSYRYTSEDVPFGVVVIKGISEIAGVKTPVMDTVIAWTQEKLGKEYIVGSELKGRDIGSTRAPGAYGFKTLDDLCKHV